MTSSIRGFFLTTTSAVALSALAAAPALADEKVLLPDGTQVVREDGKVLIRKDNGSYAFVDRETLDVPKSAQKYADGGRDPLPGETKVLPAAMSGARSISSDLSVFAGHSALHGNGIDGTDSDAAYPLVGGIASVDLPFDTGGLLESDTTSLQLDLVGEGAFSSGPDDTSDSLNYTGQAVLGAHLNYRQTNEFLAGVFGGGGKAFLDDTDSSTGKGANLVFAGVEGQMYFDDLLPGNLTAYGQTGWIDSSHDGDGSLENAWFARLVGRYFFDVTGVPFVGGDWKAAMEATYALGEQDDGGDSVSVVGWGVELEHPFHSWGADDGFATGFIRYDGRHYDDFDGTTFFEHTVLMGVKFAVNQMSMLSRDRTGATLDLPNMGRLVMGTAGLN